MPSGKFAVADAEKTFRALLAEQSLALGALTPAQGFAMMIDFFTDWEPGGVEQDSDGDGLLFQWGTYDWSASGDPKFELDLTRQFSLPQAGDEYEDEDADDGADDDDGDNDNDDDGAGSGAADDELEFGEGIFQLSLTFLYPATENSTALGSGETWFFAPVDAADLTAGILDAPVIASATALGSASVRLVFETV